MNKKYLVMDPKHAIKVQLKGQEKPKVQNVPTGTIITKDEAHAKSAVKAGKLKLYVAEEATEKAGDTSAMEAAFEKKLEKASEVNKKVTEELKQAKKDLTATKKKLTAVEKDLKFAQA